LGVSELSGTLERPQRAQHLTFQTEKFSQTYMEAVGLLRLHWKEIAPYQDLFTLNPNTAYYREGEKLGAIHIITARMDGLLIGYIVMQLNPHPHYKHVKIATDDIHFLHPDYRRGSVGTRLFLAAEKAMKTLGAQVMVLRCKAAHNHGVLFERIGYNVQDIVYSKRLDGD
jgi:GNAT superfamily N-acetyltransferase